MDTDELLAHISTEVASRFDDLFQTLHRGLGLNRDVADMICEASRAVAMVQLVHLALNRPESFRVGPGPDDEVPEWAREGDRPAAGAG